MLTQFEPGPETSRAYRDALGCFATGVTVITAATPNGPLGITANSFASVSLDPPLVLWSPAKSAGRHDPFVAAEHFAIHVLTDDQADLGSLFVKDATPFNQLTYEMNSHGVPLLTGCLARFECQKNAVHDAGDHSIILGLVRRAATQAGAPLLFAMGQYGHFAPSNSTRLSQHKNVRPPRSPRRPLLHNFAPCPRAKRADFYLIGS